MSYRWETSVVIAASDLCLAECLIFVIKYTFLRKCNRHSYIICICFYYIFLLCVSCTSCLKHYCIVILSDLRGFKWWYIKRYDVNKCHILSFILTMLVHCYTIKYFDVNTFCGNRNLILSYIWHILIRMGIKRMYMPNADWLRL